MMGVRRYGENWFPEQARLTGEFYVGGESYHRLQGASSDPGVRRDPVLGAGVSGPGDYLGLHVWLRYDPESGRLWNHRNSDSMVI